MTTTRVWSRTCVYIWIQSSESREGRCLCARLLTDAESVRGIQDVARLANATVTPRRVDAQAVLTKAGLQALVHVCAQTQWQSLLALLPKVSRNRLIECIILIYCAALTSDLIFFGVCFDLKEQRATRRSLAKSDWRLTRCRLKTSKQPSERPWQAQNGKCP